MTQIYYPLYKSGASGAIVQRITRQSEGLRRAFDLVKGKKMAENWLFTYSNPNCTHSDTCGCILKVTGRGRQTTGLSWEGKPVPVKEQLFEAAIWMEATARKQNGVEVNETEQYLRAKITRESSIRVIDAPMKVESSFPTDVILPTPSKEVQEALKRSDYVDFEELGLGYSYEEMEEWVWSETTPEIPGTATPDRPGVNATVIRPLWALAMRQESKYHWVCGKTNGRPHAVSAMSGMYPRKFPDAILRFDRTEPTEKMKEALELLQPTLSNMCRMMGIDLEQKRTFHCSMKSCQDMYLGAASGLMPAYADMIKIAHDEYVKISNRGKKIDFHEQVLMQLYRFIVWNEEPNILWISPPKNEVFFEFVKQWDNAQWAAFVEKLRLFNIPTSVYIYLERVAYMERHLLERGKQIRIGSKWSRGGSQILAECLGIDKTNCWEKGIVEGDFKAFDQSVRNPLMKIYNACNSLHYDETKGDFDVLERITKFVTAVSCYRVTHLMLNLWVIIKGSVASGEYNTSHKDSWITSFVFSGFLMWMLYRKTPIEHQEEVELYILAVIKMVCYGDDHLYRIGTSKWSVMFGGDQWAYYCKEFWNMDIRDLKRVSYCTVHRNGWITEMGACFLKYLQVENENHGPGQPDFLPFRETRDFVVRAVYSREPKIRDTIDVMMSTIGQAYATYASNKVAYKRLRNFYIQLYEVTNDRSSLAEKMMNRLQDAKDIRRIRQMGITPEELVSGFPTFEHLVEKNVIDRVYQDNSRIELGYDVTVDDYEGYM